MTQNEFLDLVRLTLSPVELMVRGTLMFWFLFLIFRFVLRRHVGQSAFQTFSSSSSLATRHGTR